MLETSATSVSLRGLEWDSKGVWFVVAQFIARCISLSADGSITFRTSDLSEDIAGSAKREANMQFKKLFLLFIASVVVLGILGLSIWYRWNTDQKLAQQRIPEITPSAEFNHGAPWIRDVAISPVNPNPVASVAERNVIKVWERNSPNVPMLTLTDHPGKENGWASITIDYIAFSPIGEWLASTDFWNLVFWDVSSGKQINTFEISAITAAISPDGHLLATASNAVKLWDIRNPKKIKEIIVLPPKMGRQPLSHEEARSTHHRNETIGQRYRVIDFSSNGKWIAAGGSMHDVNRKISRGVVKIWDLQHKQLVKIFPRALPKGVKLQPNTDYSDIRSISFSPDNRFFASVGSYGYTIWTLPEWHIYCDVRAQYSSGGSFSVDGKEIYTGGYTQIFSDLAFSPDGKMYAVADLGPVTLWSIESATPIALLLSSASVITFSQDGSTLVGGGRDGVVRLWDVGGLNEK